MLDHHLELLSVLLCQMRHNARAQVNMSVAVIPMAAELGWSASDRGLVSSAFFWGYSATQIPAGWVSTRWDLQPLENNRPDTD